MLVLKRIVFIVQFGHNFFQFSFFQAKIVNHCKDHATFQDIKPQLEENFFIIFFIIVFFKILIKLRRIFNQLGTIYKKLL